jgi:hypothetical protein
MFMDANDMEQFRKIDCPYGRKVREACKVSENQVKTSRRWLIVIAVGLGVVGLGAVIFGLTIIRSMI